MDSKTTKISIYLTEKELKLLKDNSKENGFSMNQLIKNHIQTLDSKKENTAITENFNDIKNLIASQRQILDTTAIDEEIRKTSMTMLENNYDLIETVKEKTNDDKNEINENTNQNFKTLIEIFHEEQKKNDEKINAVMMMITYLLKLQQDFPTFVGEIKEQEDSLYKVFNYIINLTTKLTNQIQSINK